MERQSSNNHGLIIFRRWSRKSYAVFSSLSKVIRIGILSLVYSILALPGHTQQRADTLTGRDLPSEQQLQEVVVSAQLSPVVQSQLMRVVQVVSRTEIEQAPARDLASLLSNLRGVDIRKRGTYGMQADISIRGGTFDQTLILINGVNITDPQTGHHNLNLPVDLQSIERIEVLQGAGARIFGPNAFNGAINIITRQPGNQDVSVSLAGGEFGYGDVSASSGFRTGSLKHRISIFGARSDGFTENTDFNSSGLFYHGRMELGLSNLDFQGGYNQKAFGANSFYTPRFPNQFEATRTGFTALRWSPVNLNFNATGYWRQHHDRFELFRNTPPSWYAGHNYHMSNVAGLALGQLFSSSFGITTLGLDYRFEHIYSNVLGEKLNQPIPVKGYDGVLFTHSSQRTGVSFMVEHNYFHGPFSASAGVLTYFNTSLKQRVNFFPGLDLAWKFNNHIRWFSSINRTLRLPTFTDLYYSGPGNIGNPSLKPEEAVSWETGLKWNFGSFSGEFAVFERHGTNMIDWVKQPGDEKWRSMNHTKIKLSGFEVGFKTPVKIRRISQLNPQLSIDYSYTISGKSSGELISNYALDHLRNKIDLMLRLPVTSNMGTSINVSWIERAGGYMLYRNGVFGEIIGFEPYFMTDLKIYYKIWKTEWFVEFSNLLDTHYVSIANVPQPGRWGRIGVAARF